MPALLQGKTLGAALLYATKDNDDCEVFDYTGTLEEDIAVKLRYSPESQTARLQLENDIDITTQRIQRLVDDNPLITFFDKQDDIYFVWNVGAHVLVCYSKAEIDNMFTFLK